VAALLFVTASGTRNLGKKSVAPEGGDRGSLVKPLKFDQKLLVCNAYPSKSAVSVSKNGQTLGGAAMLGFQQCKYTTTGVLAKDKIDFMLADAGIEGTFEVGDLPQTDAVLLLVLQKHDDHSPLMAFQSFAFPPNSGADEAHVAVIDATVGSGKAHLQIADRPIQGDAKRVEELSFNRVYALDQGRYDLAVLDQDKASPKEEVGLLGRRDYVLMRTGEGLVAFPKDEFRSGAARPAMFAAAAAMAAWLLA